MNQTLKAGLKNWKTTAVSVLVAIAALADSLAAYLDDDPATEPNFTLVLGLISVAIGLFFSRDADKSSQDSGVRD